MAMLICMEGLDCSGKTTTLKRIGEEVKKLAKRNAMILSAYGHEIKKHIEPLIETWEGPSTMNFVFGGLFAELRHKVETALGHGHIVLLDRWDGIYNAHNEQFGELSINQAEREHLHKMIFRGIRPDLTFLLHLSAEEAHDRMGKRREKSSFDTRGLEYHRAIGRHYLESAQSKNWEIIDATLPSEEIVAKVLEKIKSYAKQHGW